MSTNTNNKAYKKASSVHVIASLFTVKQNMLKIYLKVNRAWELHKHCTICNIKWQQGLYNIK